MVTIVDSAPTPVESRPFSSHVLPALFFILLVLALNYPLALNLGSHVVSNPFDDTFEVIWQLAHTKPAVFDTHTNPFSPTVAFYPHRC